MPPPSQPSPPAPTKPLALAAPETRRWPLGAKFHDTTGQWTSRLPREASCTHSVRVFTQFCRDDAVTGPSAPGRGRRLKRKWRAGGQSFVAGAAVGPAGWPWREPSAHRRPRRWPARRLSLASVSGPRCTQRGPTIRRCASVGGGQSVSAVGRSIVSAPSPVSPRTPRFRRALHAHDPSI